MADAGVNDIMMVAMNRSDDSLGHHVAGPVGELVFGLLDVWANQRVSRGTLSLASADPFDHAVIEENILDHPSDLERLRDGLRRLMATGRHASV
jgi:choline dehydrogenase-like flavoprotein